MKLKLIQTSNHRNGICGTPFDVTLFKDEDGSTKVLFDFGDESGCYGVLDVGLLAKNDVAFGSNSWRGDHYIDAIRKLTKNAKPAIDHAKIAAVIQPFINKVKEKQNAA